MRWNLLLNFELETKNRGTKVKNKGRRLIGRTPLILGLAVASPTMCHGELDVSDFGARKLERGQESCGNSEKRNSTPHSAYVRLL